MSALDPRLRREEQLRELYSLPILARVPKEKRAPTFTLGKRRFGIGPRERERRALPPGELSAATLESYRTLRTMLAAQRRDDGNSRSILVTGPSPSEGKTTTAINLASSLALAGNRVILIEADFRRPDGRRGARRRAPAWASATCCSATSRSRTRWCWRRRSATTSACCSSTAPTTGWPRCSRCRPPRPCSRTPSGWPTTWCSTRRRSPR